MITKYFLSNHVLFNIFNHYLDVDKNCNHFNHDKNFKYDFSIGVFTA